MAAVTARAARRFGKRKDREGPAVERRDCHGGLHRTNLPAANALLRQVMMECYTSTW